jgi:hypothetical protein
MPAKRPEGPALSGQRPPVLARTASAQVKLTNPVDSVRRADRGPAPITCLVHLLPPAGSAAGPRCPVRDPVLIAHHFTSASPARPFSGHWHHRPDQSRFAQRRSPSSRLRDTLRRPAQPAQGAGPATKARAASPLSIQSGRFPAQIQARPARTAVDRCQKRTLTARLNPGIPAGQPSSSRQRVPVLSNLRHAA